MPPLTIRPVVGVTVFALAIAFCVGCSSAGDGAPTGGGVPDSGTDSPSMPPGGVGKSFWPEDVALEQIAPQDMRGLNLEGATLGQVKGVPTWVVAVRNMGPTIACSPEVRAVFEDAAMGEVGAAIITVQAPMHRTTRREPCLPVGEIGIGAAPIEMSGAAGPIKRIGYRFAAYLETTAEKLSEVTLEDLTIADPSAATTRVSGTLINHGTVDLVYAEVLFYPLDAVSRRPLTEAVAPATAVVAAGAKWNFAMMVPGPISSHMEFAHYLTSGAL